MKEKSEKWVVSWIVGPLLWGVLLISGQVRMGLAMDKQHQQGINCDIQNQACIQTFSNRKISLDITPKPVKAMTDLAFYVKISGKKLDYPPFIDLGMPGMKMGPNRVRLEPVGQNTFTGKGVIVKCPSGRTIWRATVTLPEEGGVDFIFNVIY